MERRDFLKTSGSAVAVGLAAQAGIAHAADAVGEAKGIRIVGICGSPRKGKTTSAALRVALESAQSVGRGVEVELLELSDYRIEFAGTPAAAQGQDDFPTLAAKLIAPSVGGIVIGTPVYMGLMSGMCKNFLDRLAMMRTKDFALGGKVFGAVAVGGIRNGGQDATVQALNNIMLCQDMIVVGDGKPTAHWGATLLNDGKDDISTDTFGLATAKGVGRRVAEVALRQFAAAR
jgi:multimeric flavodoxin WrbA